jgi:hypothetical protein
VRSHLTDDMLAEALDGLASAEARRHLGECAHCTSRLDEARLGQELAHDADVPEPPPLYWEIFRRQVGQRIATDAPARRAVAFWLFPALATLAVLIAVGIFRGPGGPSAAPVPTLPAWSALPAAEDDEGLEVLQALAAQGDPLDAALPPQTLAGDLSLLSDEESEVLVDALRAEMTGAGTL